jgi:hypothetical protein
MTSQNQAYCLDAAPPLFSIVAKVVKANQIVDTGLLLLFLG